MVEGTQVGAYRVVKQIGEGGMGSVWLAEHIALGRRAALKVLHPEFSTRPDTVAQFFNEARAATAIADPGIVQIFDFGQHVDGTAYIVMELLDGEPLDHRLAREGALTLADGLRLMRQVASTLGAAHARGIVHRDLKPENVFVVRDPEVPGGERAKVLDFGIAKLGGEQGGVKTQTSAVMGTPAYMSPEQCRGAGHVDQRSDVYALGCMLFALMTGRPPFQADGAGELIAMHLREPAPAPSQLRPGIPHELDQLVLRCLAKDPAQRFASGAELAIAIGGLLGSSPQVAAAGAAGYAPAHAPTTLSAASGARSLPPPKRSRAGAFAAVAGACVAGVVAVAFATRGDAPGEPGSAHVLAGQPRPADRPSAQVAPAPAPPSPTAQVAPPPASPSPSAQVAPRIADALGRFAAWSHTHPGAPCPDAAALGAPGDPWGHPLTITCTEQPGDQIAGAISAGPDGTPGTDDDIASWQLGGDVLVEVHGARWGGGPRRGQGPAAAAKSSIAARPPAAAKPVNAHPRPADAPARTAPAVQLDENGLPISR